MKSKTLKVYRSFSNAYWCMVVAVYLMFSFIFGHWGISWVIFLVAAAAQNIIRGFIEFSEDDYEK